MPLKNYAGYQQHPTLTNKRSFLSRGETSAKCGEREVRGGGKSAGKEEGELGEKGVGDEEILRFFARAGGVFRASKSDGRAHRS